ncbi:hypothetical protein MNV49_001141 [Pseudohyphozyma bogoriensis]|nr:hypothetical protein MNV49_001141 [Pseudohyphozyma bogoriensis]
MENLSVLYGLTQILKLGVCGFEGLMKPAGMDHYGYVAAPLEECHRWRQVVRHFLESKEYSSEGYLADTQSLSDLYWVCTSRKVRDAAGRDLKAMAEAFNSGGDIYDLTVMTRMAYRDSEQFTDPRLKSAYNLIALDARLHGYTYGEELEKYTMEDAANELIKALEMLGIEKYSILGESFYGAHVGTWMAIKKPERVEGLVLCSPAHLTPNEEYTKSMLQDWWEPYAANKGPGKTGEIPPEQLKVRDEFFFGGMAREPERKALFETAFQQRYGPGHSARDMRHIVSFHGKSDISDGLRSTVTCPVLILHGGLDKDVSPLSAAIEWQKGFPYARGGADVREIASAPHILTYTSASIVNRFVVAFLAKYNGTAAGAGDADRWSKLY